MISIIKYHPDWGPKKLAEYFEISEKRIYDDINELNAANMPVIFSGKGYKFLTQQSLPPVNFTVDEALSLLISSTAMQSRTGQSYSQAAKSASIKLLELLPDSTKKLMLAISGKVKLESKGRSRVDPAMKLITEAIASKQSVKFKYHSYSSGVETERSANPLGLVFRGNAWYMIADCHTRKEIRTFRLNRISNIRLTDSRFDYPEDFSIEKHLENSWHIFQGNETEVTVKFSERVAPLIVEHQWQPDQKIEIMPDGSITYMTIVKGTLEIKRWILSWGQEAEVLSPASLRLEIADAVSNLDGIYSRRETDKSYKYKKKVGEERPRKVAENKITYTLKDKKAKKKNP